MDNAPVKVKNNESGTITAQLSAAEVTSMNVDPVPQYAPGVLVMSPGTDEEEHIFFRKRDAVGGTVSGLIRDITNLNGGDGRLHINGTSWESMQASEYVNFIVEALLRGWMVEPQIIAYVSGTSFTVQGNQTDRYTGGRFLRIDEDDAKIAVVVSSSYSGGTGLTTVTTKGFAIPDPVTTIEVQIGQPNGWTGNQPIFYGEDAGGDDTYAVTVEPDFGAYFKGMIILFEATTANTGACTLNVNALGAKDIKTLQGNDPLTGEILAGHMVMAIYNGTNFRLLTSGVPGMIDEDTMSSDSATRVPSQQSAKAYTDTSIAAVNTLTLTEAPGSDHTANGIKETLTAGENLVFGDVCYFKSDGKMWKADADAIATASVIGMALATISADATGSFLMIGVARDDTWAWTVGGIIYLSTTAGALTQTAPSGTDDVVQILGIATHADRMYFNPQLVQIEHV